MNARDSLKSLAIFAPRIFRPTCLEIKKIPGEGSLTVTDKEIQSRNEERISQNTKRSPTWITRVWDHWVKKRNTLPRQRHFHGSSKTWNFKEAVQFRTVVLAVEIEEPPTKKIRECGSRETQPSLIAPHRDFAQTAKS